MWTLLSVANPFFETILAKRASGKSGTIERFFTDDTNEMVVFQLLEFFSAALSLIVIVTVCINGVCVKVTIIFTYFPELLISTAPSMAPSGVSISGSATG